MRAALFVALIVLSGGMTRADESVIATQQWYDSLQAIGAKYRKGTTQAQSNLRRKQLYVELTERKEERVRMESAVKAVRWKNGVAEIQAGSFLPAVDPKAPKPLMNIYRSAPLELWMSEEEAVAIEPGTPIVFEGTLTFQPGRHGAVGLTLKTQQMHALSHAEMPGTPLGTFTSADCVFSIGGKVYPSRWSR